MRPATYPQPKPGAPDTFGFRGTDRPALLRQYEFFLRAYGLPEATPCADADGEPSWCFTYPEGGHQVSPKVPPRVWAAIDYLIEALQPQPA